MVTNISEALIASLVEVEERCGYQTSLKSGVKSQLPLWEPQIQQSFIQVIQTSVWVRKCVSILIVAKLTWSQQQGGSQA
jgi:hypothetical protein